MMHGYTKNRVNLTQISHPSIQAKCLFEDASEEEGPPDDDGSVFVALGLLGP